MNSRLLLAAILAAALSLPALAADNGDKPNAGTGKGAAVGAAAGHEVGSGHAVAGAAVGAGIGHHEEKKAEEKKK
jgi:opacity protein-like surface antigen